MPARSDGIARRICAITSSRTQQFRFDRRLRSLLGHTPRELAEFVSEGFGRPMAQQQS
jgi:hypothetical protein